MENLGRRRNDRNGDRNGGQDRNGDRDENVFKRKLTLPPLIEAFRIKYINALWKEHLDPRKTIIFGGCIRDMILGGEIKDYDMVTGYPKDRITKVLDKHHIRYKNGTGGTKDHIYIILDNEDILEIGETPNKVPDYTINGFVCNFVDLQIEICKECEKDIIEHRLRLIDIDNPRAFRRGIYMCYRYPFLNFTENSLEHLRRMNPNEEITIGFIEKKKMSIRDFYEIAKRWGLHKQVSFLRKYSLDIKDAEV